MRFSRKPGLFSLTSSSKHPHMALKIPSKWTFDHIKWPLDGFLTLTIKFGYFFLGGVFVLLAISGRSSVYFLTAAEPPLVQFDGVLVSDPTDAVNLFLKSWLREPRWASNLRLFKCVCHNISAKGTFPRPIRLKINLHGKLTTKVWLVWVLKKGDELS